MRQAKLSAIALVIFFTVCPALNQEATAQAKKGSVNLKGNWQESSRIFYWSNPGSGCKANPRVVTRKVTLNTKGTSLTIPTFRYWGSPQGQRGSYGATTTKVSGRAVNFTIKGGGFTASYKGTVNNDSNKITGRVVCTHSSGRTKADVPFTISRVLSRRITAPLNGRG